MIRSGPTPADVTMLFHAASLAPLDGRGHRVGRVESERPVLRLGHLRVAVSGGRDALGRLALGASPLLELLPVAARWPQPMPDRRRINVIFNA